MFGLPIIIAALTLMGAPSSTPAYCNPQTTSERQAYGLTWHYADGTVTHMDFAPIVCGGLLYLSASPAERTKLRALNPGVDFTRLEGVSLLVVLHESYHAAGHFDETETECAAMKALPSFVAQQVGAEDQSQAIAWATSSDAGLPSTYHTRPCNA